MHGAAEPVDALGALLFAGLGEVGGGVAQRLGGALLQGVGRASEKSGLRALVFPRGGSILFLQGLFNGRFLAERGNVAVGL
jgi:hypothetical protein